MNEEAPLNEKLTVVRLKDEDLVDQLCHRARQCVLAWLRERSEPVFWHGSISEVLGYFSFGRFLGISRSERLNLQSVAKILVHHSPFPFRTFAAHWTGGDGSNPRVQVCLTGTAEWTDVLKEAWEGMERPPHNLSEPAGNLLNWVQQAKNQSSWIHRSAIGRQAKLRGTSWTADFLAGLFKEIQRKANIGLKLEQKDDEFRLSFEAPTPTQPPARQHGPLNPMLEVDFSKVEFAELDQFREGLYDWILAANLPTDDAQLTIWCIQERATLFRCFPQWTKENWGISTIVNFLSQVGLDHGLLWGYSFQDPMPWTYVCGPKQGMTWHDVAASIRKARSLPPLAERYGISSDAAALLKWFTTLRAKDWLGGLTPPLEENLKQRIGISTDWDEKNLPVYFSMLAEEISEQTEWKVAVKPWSGRWGGTTHRLLVKRKQTAFEEVVRQIQVLGISQGKLLTSEKVRVALRTTLDAE